jgi:hypothetical protein
VALNASRLFSSASFAVFLLENYDNDLFLKLAEYKLGLLAGKNGFIRSVSDFWNAVLTTEPQRKMVTEAFYDFNVKFISGRYSIESEKNYAGFFLNYLASVLNKSVSAIYESVFNRIADDTVLAENVDDNIIDLFRTELPIAMRRQEENLSVHAGIRQMENDGLGKALGENIDQFREKTLKEMLKVFDSRKNLPIDTGDDIYIKNAGLVLFYPFLITYLERTGLLEDKQFINEQARNRAVLLLQYLATGFEEFDEFDLVLNKIICAVPLDEAILLSFAASELEKNTTEELYEVFIQRWPQMKNSSIDGIRGSFIMRDGVLRFSDDGWVLRVEQKAYDLLLQTLPWAFGFIKTPMMEKILLVEWT